MSKPPFTAHSVTVSVRPERGLKKRDVIIGLVTPGDERFVDQPIEAAFGLGLGNGQKAAQRALGHVMLGNRPRNVALIAAFSYWRMSSAAGLTELAIEGWRAVHEYLVDLNADRNSTQPLHAGTDSQAAFSLARACDGNAELFPDGRLAFVHPHAVLQMTGWQIVKGLGASLRQRDQLLDWRGYSVGGTAALVVTDDFLFNRRRGMKFATDPNSNVGESLVNLVKERGVENIRVLCGERDLLYPATPLQERLGELGIGEVFELMPNASHSSHATKAGAQQLEQALDWLCAPASPASA